MTLGWPWAETEKDMNSLSVWAARSCDGFCNACSPDEYGRMPNRGSVVAIRAGNLVMRLCKFHMRAAATQAHRILGS